MTEEARAARYDDLFERPDHAASDCAYCPICAAISVIRKTKPEVLDHLATAARELIVVAGLLLEEAESVMATPGGHGHQPSDAKVRKVDIG